LIYLMRTATLSNPYVEKRGEKLKPCRIISASDKLKGMIPYDEKFINCGLDELDSYIDERAGL